MEMTGRKSETVTPEVILGALLLLVGAVLLFDRMNLFTVAQVLRFWPIALIGGGTALLLEHFDGPPHA